MISNYSLEAADMNKTSWAFYKLGDTVTTCEITELDKNSTKVTNLTRIGKWNGPDEGERKLSLPHLGLRAQKFLLLISVLINWKAQPAAPGG